MILKVRSSKVQVDLLHIMKLLQSNICYFFYNSLIITTENRCRIQKCIIEGTLSTWIHLVLFSNDLQKTSLLGDDLTSFLSKV